MHKRLSIWTTPQLVLCLASGLVLSTATAEDMLSYRVTSIDPGSWTVTAEQLGTGETIQFVMKSNTFKGTTFDADLSGVAAGDRFSARGPRNARVEATELKRAPAANERARNTTARPQGSAGAWEIVTVDPRKWIVTARQRGAPPIRFEVDPQAFVGFEFHASVKDVAAGRGFTVVTPNNSALSNCCKLLD